MPHVIQSLFHLLLQICRRATHRDQIRLAKLSSVRTPIELDPPESRSTKKARIPWKWKEAWLIRSGKVRGDELSTVNIQKVRKRGKSDQRIFRNGGISSDRNRLFAQKPRAVKYNT